MKKTNNYLSHQEKMTLLSVTRQMIYIIIQMISIIIMWRLADIYRTDTVSEFGILETLQIVVLAAACLLFVAEALRTQPYRPILMGLAALCLAAIIRENDSYFEEVFPVVSWKFCHLFPLLALAYMLRYRKQLRNPLFSFLRTNSFLMLLLASALIIPIAQCVGHRSFLADITGVDPEAAGTIRRCVEEPLELLGYIQIFLSGIEIYFELLRPERSHASRERVNNRENAGNENPA